MPTAYYQENMEVFIENLNTSIFKTIPSAVINKLEDNPPKYSLGLLKASNLIIDLIIYATEWRQ